MFPDEVDVEVVAGIGPPTVCCCCVVVVVGNGGFADADVAVFVDGVIAGVVFSIDVVVVGGGGVGGGDDVERVCDIGVEVDTRNPST